MRGHDGGSAAVALLGMEAWHLALPALAGAGVTFLRGDRLSPMAWWGVLPRAKACPRPDRGTLRSQRSEDSLPSTLCPRSCIPPWRSLRLGERTRFGCGRRPRWGVRIFPAGVLSFYATHRRRKASIYWESEFQVSREVRACSWLPTSHFPPHTRPKAVCAKRTQSEGSFKFEVSSFK